MTRVNLDGNAQTAAWPEVKAAMLEAIDLAGNPSSTHQAGRKAKQWLERARADVAALINAPPENVHFTSCATESNAWALRGLVMANKRPKPHVIVSAIEHPSVLLAARRLELDGVSVTRLPVDGQARVSVESLKAALTENTVLVSVMAANGEVGMIQPVAELAAAARAAGALFHTDAVAACGYSAVDARAWRADALTLSANAWHGPAGAAALFVREGVRILPLLEGGGQEHGGRSGTEALAAIAGMGAAAVKVRAELGRGTSGLSALRDRLQEGLSQGLDRLRVNGDSSQRLPNNLHVCVEGVASETLVLGLDQEGIAAGLGSACNAKSMRPSHVLKAMGFTDAQAAGALVLSLNWMTTAEEIDRAIAIIPAVAAKLRRVSALTARS